MTEKKRGRGRPKGAPNKPKMKLITERVKLQKNADVYEILCQAELVAQVQNAIGRELPSLNKMTKPDLQFMIEALVG